MSSGSNLRLVAKLVLLICLVCPTLEVFDYWDHTAQTGNDTEYTLVLVGLCVGVAYTSERFILPRAILKTVSGIVVRFSAAKPVALSARRCFFIVPIPLSPPALALRI